MTPPHAGDAGLAEDLARHASFGCKVSGSAGDLATAQWIAARLRLLGFSVKEEPVEVPYFEPESCELRCGDARAMLYPQAPVLTVAAGGLEAPLVVVRAAADAAEASGAIALLLLPHGLHASLDSPVLAPLLAAVLAAGARAAVIVPTGPTGEWVALNAPLQADRHLPLAVLAPRDAEPFLAAARRGASARLLLAGRQERRRTPNLHAQLRRGPRWLCLSTPRTGWFTCATERGTGTAAFLAMAAWAVHRFPAHSVYAVNTGAHEYRFAGAHAALAQAPLPACTDAWVHFGAALAARDRLEIRGRAIELPSAESRRFTMATPALAGAAREAFAGLPGLEVVLPPVPEVSELGAIVARGYERAFAVLGLPRVFHTPADVLEATDARLVAPVLRAHMAVVEAALA
ncbi:MAG TPA: hypothetical protein VEA40_22625 [Ramlibacter sp.]|nr:hypothetical protein [Ramlibacter sp.]